MQFELWKLSAPFVAVRHKNIISSLSKIKSTYCNPNFCVKNGIVFDKPRTHLLCATDRAVGEKYRVPEGVTHINRGVFSGCPSLREIDFGGVTCIDKSSFTNCTGLTELYIPDAVTYIGEWAFSYCTNLRKISINQKTFVDKNAFNECPVSIEWRE